MKSILFSSFVDKSLFLTHFEFSLFYHEEIIGEYQLTFEYDKVTLSIFQIKLEINFCEFIFKKSISSCVASSKRASPS